MKNDRSRNMLLILIIVLLAVAVVCVFAIFEREQLRKSFDKKPSLVINEVQGTIVKITRYQYESKNDNLWYSEYITKDNDSDTCKSFYTRGTAGITDNGIVSCPTSND